MDVYGFEECSQCGAIPGLVERGKGKNRKYQFLCSGQKCRHRKGFGEWFGIPAHAKAAWNTYHKDMKDYLTGRKAEATQ